MSRTPWIQALARQLQTPPRQRKNRLPAAGLPAERLELRALLAAGPVGEEFLVNSTTADQQNSSQVAVDEDGDFVVTWASRQDGSGYGIYAQRFNAAGVPQGNEFRVNVTTANNQFAPAVAMEASGDFVVTWQSYQDGSSYGVYGRRYSAAGAVLSGEFRVNVTTFGRQSNPAIGMDADGDFVITWKGNGAGGYGVYARRYNSAGAVQGGEFQVHVGPAAFTLDRASVGLDADGDFVVAWTTVDTELFGIAARRFNAAGVAQGGEIPVNVTFTGNQNQPTVGVDASGDFVVAWSSPDGNETGILARRFDATGAGLGGEILVNTTTTGVQMEPAVSMDADGDFVVAWGGYNQTYFSYAIQAQRFNAAGTPQDGQFQVNTSVRQGPRAAAIALDADGDFIVSWTGFDSFNGGDGVLAQRFQADAPRNLAPVPQGGEVLVNTTTLFHQRDPVVAQDADGDYVVVWSGYGDGSGEGIYLQRYNAAGVPQGGEVLVNTTTDSVQRNPAVAMDDNGNFVVTWSSFSDGGGYGVFAQRFNAAAAPKGGQFRVNVTTANNEDFSSVAMDADGDFVVTWISLGQDGSGDGVYARRYSAAGAVLSGEFRVNSFTTGNQNDASVAMDFFGGFVVTWASDNSQDGSDLGVYARRYSSGGAPQGGEFRVNSTTIFRQHEPAVAMEPDGDFIITFTGYGDSDGYGIYARRYNSVGTPDGPDRRINAFTPGSQRDSSVAVDADGDVVVTWTGTDANGYGLFGQRFDAAGARQGPEFRVNTTTTNHQDFSAVAMSAHGDIVAAWVSLDQDGSAGAIVAQRYRFNNAPVLSANAFQFYTENDPPIAVTSGFLFDADSPNFAGGALTVTLPLNGQSSDRLSVRYEGNGAGQIGVSGNNVSFGGTLIGTLSGGVGTTPLVVALNANATPTAAQALMGRLHYHNVSDNPTSFGAFPNRTVRFQLSDGAGGVSHRADVTLIVSTVNDPPTIGGVSGATSYTENAAPVLLIPTATVTDLDSPDFNGGSISVLTTSGVSADDRLSVRHVGAGPGQIGLDGSTVMFEGAPIGFFFGGGGTTDLSINLTTDVPSSTVRALLRAITFAVASEHPTTANRVVRFLLSDGDGGTSLAVNKTVTVTRVNDAPGLGGIPSPQTYTENGVPKPLVPVGVVVDPDSFNFDTGKLTVKYTAGGLGSDRLAIRNQETEYGDLAVIGTTITFNGNPIATFTGGAGLTPLVVTFNSAATTGNVGLLLRNIVYQNVSDNPTNFGAQPSRTVNYVFTDGDGGTTVVNQSLNITAVNDAPALGGIASPQTYIENGAAKLLASTATAADPDSANFDSGKLTVKYTAGGLGSDRLTIRNQGAGNGQIGLSGSTITFSGSPIGSFTGGTGLTPLVITFNSAALPGRVLAVLRNILYQNISDNPTNFGANPSRTINYVLTDGDGGTSPAVNQTLNVTAANDAPIVGGFDDASNYTSGAPATILDANATLTDPDSANFTGGNFVLQFTAGAVGSNLLAIRNQGTAAGQIGVSGNNVTFGGTVIGTLNANGGVGLTALIVTFTPAATPAAAQALLRNLTYRSTVADPTGPKTLTLKVRDGDGGLTTVNKTLNIAPALVAPPRSSTAFAAYAEWEHAL